MTLHVWLPAIRAQSGVDVYTQRLADALGRAGIKATITWLPSWREFLPNLIRNTRPPSGTTVIHSNSWSAHAFQDLGCPLVVSMHSSSVQDPDWSREASIAQRTYYRFCVRHWEARSIAAATAITVVSHFVNRSLVRTYGVNSGRVIYNWVNTELFHPGPPRSPDQYRFRLLFVGNLTRRKGADLLLRIAERLGSRFELRFVGRRQKRPAQALPENMIYTDPVHREEDMASLYRWCDALLVPSRLEGFGYAPLEALACGRPVIATNISALPEIVRDDQSGFLCPLDNVEAFVAACQRLASDRSLYRQMSDAARQDATQRFTEKKAVSAYIDLYQDILSK